MIPSVSGDFMVSFEMKRETQKSTLEQMGQLQEEQFLKEPSWISDS